MDYVINAALEQLRANTDKYSGKCTVKWTVSGSSTADAARNNSERSGKKPVQQPIITRRTAVLYEKAIPLIIEDFKKGLLSAHKYIFITIKPSGRPEFQKSGAQEFQNWTHLSFANPNAGAANQKNMLAGLNSNNNILSVLLEQQRSMYQQQLQAMEAQRKQDLENLKEVLLLKRDLEDSRAETLAARESAKVGFIGQLKGLLEHPAAQNVLIGLVSKFAGLDQGAAAATVAGFTGAGQEQGEQEQSSGEDWDDLPQEHSAEDIAAMQNRLNRSLSKIEKVFGKETIDALDKLGDYAENNPAAAKAFLSNL